MGSNLTKRISALSCNSWSNELGGSPSQSIRSRAQALTTSPYHHIPVWTRCAASLSIWPWNGESQRRHQTMCTFCWHRGVHFSARADGHGSRALQQGLVAGSRGKLASARERCKSRAQAGMPRSDDTAEERKQTAGRAPWAPPNVGTHSPVSWQGLARETGAIRERLRPICASRLGPVSDLALQLCVEVAHRRLLNNRGRLLFQPQTRPNADRASMCEWYLSGRSSYWERCREHWERVLVGWSTSGASEKSPRN